MIKFPHQAPKGYSYEQQAVSKTLSAIWIWNHHKFDYNGGQPVKSIWGFYNHKTQSYHAPIHSSKCGEQVYIQNTTPYSAMQIKQTPLTAAFV